jgi:hypothetical protein
VGYYYLGEDASGSLVENLPAGPSHRAAQARHRSKGGPSPCARVGLLRSTFRTWQALLFLHVVIVYVIKSVVLARFLHMHLLCAA